MTSVSAAVIIAGVITGIVVGISVNKASKHQPAIVEAAETQTEMQTHTQPESTEPEEEKSTEETFEVIDDIMEKVVTDSAVTQKEDPLKNRNNATAGEVIKPVLYVDNAVSGSVSVSSVKKSGTDVIYSLKGRKYRISRHPSLINAARAVFLLKKTEHRSNIQDMYMKLEL